MWQPSIQFSAERYSRLIHTGGCGLATIAASKLSGTFAPKASITISPGSVGATCLLHCRMSMPGASVPSRIASSVSGRSIHSLTLAPCSLASWRASRQHTPASPKLSMTLQKMSQRQGVEAGISKLEKTDEHGLSQTGNDVRLREGHRAYLMATATAVVDQINRSLLPQ